MTLSAFPTACMYIRSPGTRDEVMLMYISRNGQLGFIKFDDGSYGSNALRTLFISMEHLLQI